MTPPKGGSAYVAALKIPVTILCLFGTVLAAYYFFYVTLHRTYLIERNFRLLATIGEAIVASIENDKRVIENLAHDNYERSSRLFDRAPDGTGPPRYANAPLTSFPSFAPPK